MYDFSPQNKETAIIILIAFAVLVAVFCTGYGIGLRTAARTDAGGVHSDGTGIEPVREQLSNAAEHQRQISDGLESAVAGSDAIEARSERIEKTAGAAAQSVTDAGAIIDECQQLIGQIRNRGQKRAPTN